MLNKLSQIQILFRYCKNIFELNLLKIYIIIHILKNKSKFLENSINNLLI